MNPLMALSQTYKICEQSQYRMTCPCSFSLLFPFSNAFNPINFQIVYIFCTLSTPAFIRWCCGSIVFICGRCQFSKIYRRSIFFDISYTLLEYFSVQFIFSRIFFLSSFRNKIELGFNDTLHLYFLLYS